MEADTELLRMRDVLRLVPFKSGALYRKIKMGEFPPGVLIGPRCRTWSRASVYEFLLNQAAHAPAAADMKSCHAGRDAFWAKRRASTALTPAALAFRDAVAAAVAKDQ